MTKNIYISILSSLMVFSMNAQNLDFEQITVPQDLISIAGVTESSMAFADVDGDDDQDVLVTGLDTNEEAFTGLYLNDGLGAFSLAEDTPFQGVYQSSVAFADIDGDEDQDVLITGRTNDDQTISEFYINNGEGSFSLLLDVVLPGVYKSSIAFADVDGDDDQDVLITGNIGIGSDNKISELYINDGSGVYIYVSGIPFVSVLGGAVAFADVDGDNDQDVIFSGFSGSFSGSCKLYLNDGLGDFSASTEMYFEGIHSSEIAFADVDIDGDQDLLITGKTGSSGIVSKLYLNDGTGIFDELWNPFEGVRDGSIAFADVDNDDDLDVMITGTDDPYSSISELYINDGSGNYSLSTGSFFVPVSNGDIGFADIDGDNDLDLMITGYNTETSEGYQYKSEVYINDGLGNFLIEGNIPLQGVELGSVAFADIDGDNDQDLLITGYNDTNTDNYISNLYTNDGTGILSLVPYTPFPGVEFSSIAFADVDGDNDQDVLITGSEGSYFACELYINDGVGNYSLAEETPFQGVNHGAIAFADVDNDNDLDLMITGNQTGLDVSNLYTNDGAGTFVLVEDTPFIGVRSSALAFADVDNDNDLDVIIAGYNSSDDRITELYSNDGTGTYSLVTETNFLGVTLGSIAFADVDNDDDQDVVITGQADGLYMSELYFNDGLGNFSIYSATPFVEVASGSIAFTDFDGDADQDLLITGFGHSKLYLNNGIGGFSLDSDMPFQGVSNSSIAIADIDGDNDPDVLITGSETAKLWRNTISCTPTTGIENASICANEIMTINGNVYNAFNSTGAELIFDGAANGCDSTVIIDLNVLPEVVGIEDATICFGESILVNGTVYDASNRWGTEIIEGGAANGCDSVVDISLTVLPFVLVSIDGYDLTVSNDNATYQWLDCDDDNSPIAGETNQTFTATVNGNYAVEVTENTCVKVSDCITINTIGLSESNSNAFVVHPNPTQGEFSITFERLLSDVEISILDLQGRLISSSIYKDTNIIGLQIDEPKGIYIVHVKTAQSQQTIKVIKE